MAAVLSFILIFKEAPIIWIFEQCAAKITKTRHRWLPSLQEMCHNLQVQGTSTKKICLRCDKSSSCNRGCSHYLKRHKSGRWSSSNKLNPRWQKLCRQSHWVKTTRCLSQANLWTKHSRWDWEYKPSKEEIMALCSRPESSSKKTCRRRIFSLLRRKNWNSHPRISLKLGKSQSLHLLMQVATYCHKDQRKLRDPRADRNLIKTTSRKIWIKLFSNLKSSKKSQQLHKIR